MCDVKYSWLNRTLSTSKSSRYHSYPWGTKSHPTKRWKCCTLNELGFPNEVQVLDLSHCCKMPKDWVLLEECGREKTKMPWCWQDLFLEVGCWAVRELQRLEARSLGCLTHGRAGLPACSWEEMLQRSPVGRKPTFHRTFLQVRKNNLVFQRNILYLGLLKLVRRHLAFHV